MKKAISESKINIAGITLRCCVLDSGERIIPCEDVEKFFEAVAGGAELKEEAIQQFGKLLHGAEVMK